MQKNVHLDHNFTNLTLESLFIEEEEESTEHSTYLTDSPNASSHKSSNSSGSSDPLSNGYGGYVMTDEYACQNESKFPYKANESHKYGYNPVHTSPQQQIFSPYQQTGQAERKIFKRKKKKRRLPDSNVQHFTPAKVAQLQRKQNSERFQQHLQQSQQIQYAQPALHQFQPPQQQPQQQFVQQQYIQDCTHFNNSIRIPSQPVQRPPNIPVNGHYTLQPAQAQQSQLNQHIQQLQVQSQAPMQPQTLQGTQMGTMRVQYYNTVNQTFASQPLQYTPAQPQVVHQNFATTSVPVQVQMPTQSITQTQIQILPGVQGPQAFAHVLVPQIFTQPAQLAQLYQQQLLHSLQMQRQNAPPEGRKAFDSQPLENSSQLLLLPGGTRVKLPNPHDTPSDEQDTLVLNLALPPVQSENKSGIIPACLILPDRIFTIG